MELGWNIFPWVAVVVFVLSLYAAVLAAFRRERSRGAMVCNIAAIAIFFAFIVALWLTLKRPPLRTMGETRLWYSLFLLMAGLFTYARWHFRWILSFSTLLATVFMVINILKPEIHDQSLMPALQSVWFVPHVSVYMFSYALLGVATLVAIYYLIKSDERVVPALENLLGGGVALLTVGMLTGALWAKQAWGEYWSWDAKEAWAAVTWFVYQGAIHLRLLRPRAVKTFCVLLVVGFLSLQMCWYGVNYLPSASKSVHTYNQ